ncbi:MAG: glycosyltransferase WbuB [Opitutus sp.]|nr:glycosyltransferase WbuB [Opitutus sp.]
MPRPKLIFVNRVYWPNEAATALLLTDLAEGLAARGHEVHVVASGSGPAKHGGVALHRTGGADTHRTLPQRILNYVRFLVRARQVLLRLAAAGDIVVLKTDPPLLAAALTGPALRCGASVVQWIQDIYPELVVRHTGAWLSWPLAPMRRLRNRAWRRSAACVVAGEDMRPVVGSQGVPAGRIHVRPNWAPRELAVPADGAAVRAQRAAWGWEGKFVVAYSGNLGRVHEFTTLLAVAGRLRDEPGILFAFIGGGPRLREVQEQVRLRGLGNVRFLPGQPRDRLAPALAAADLHAVTLRPGFESLVNPSKLAGVLAAGRPALFVGPTTGSIAALLEHEGCGLAFRPGEDARAAAAIRALRDDPERVRESGRRARAAYERRLRFEDELAAWETLLGRSDGA